MRVLATHRIQAAETLWRQVPEAMALAERCLHTAMAAALEAHGGEVASVSRETIVVAFEDALTALRWCLDMQHRLPELPWPEALSSQDEVVVGLSLSVGVHAGRPIERHNPLTGGIDFIGPEVHASHGLASAAAGGQILASDTLWEALGPAGEAALEADVADLGQANIEGFDDLVQVRQIQALAHAGRVFPPLVHHALARTNIQPPSSSFIGRTEELSALGDLFEESRIVTILGPGGTGKTRLALQHGLDELNRHKGGVWFCDLIEARSLSDILAVVSRVFSVKATETWTLQEQTQHLGETLCSKGEVLLILDNFEHIAAWAADTLGQWIGAAPRASFLITSRRPLEVSGEHRFYLAPLKAEDAAALFRARALAIDGAAIDEGGPGEIAALVEHLERMPLAIELAAARVRQLTVTELRQRLSESFALLNIDTGVHTSHHRTLEAAIGWSWDRLTPWEHDALGQCARFKGGWSLSDCEAVVDLSQHPEAPSILETLTSLCDWSLVDTTQSVSGHRRFRLFESVRDFVMAHTPPPSEAFTMRFAHHFVAKCASVVDELEGPRVMTCIARIDEDLENLLATCLLTRDLSPTLSARATLILDKVLGVIGPFDLHLELLEAAIKGLEEDGSEDGMLCRLLVARAGRFYRRHNAETLRAELERAFGLASGLGDKTLECEVLVTAGTLSLYHPSAQFRPLYQRAVDLAREAEQPVLLFKALFNMSVIEYRDGALDSSEAMLEEALAYAQKHGGPPALGTIMSYLARMATRRGQEAKARTWFATALANFRNVGHDRLEALTLNYFGALETMCENPEAALTHFTQALALCRRAGDLRIEAQLLINRGILNFDQQRLGEASVDLDAAVRYFDGVGDSRYASVALAYSGALHAARMEFKASEEAFIRARKHCEGVKDPEMLALVFMLEGFLDAARAEPTSISREALERLRSSDGLTPSVRHAQSLLRRALQRRFPDDLSLQKPALTLEIARDASWFQMPFEDKISLARRVAPRRILLALLEAWAHNPGASLDVVALQEAGWPGQRLVAGTGANRVYVAIATLRKLGLGPALDTHDQGYRLSPSMPIRRSD